MAPHTPGSSDVLPRSCFALYAAAVALSAVRPASPATWLTENAAAWIIVIVMAMTVRTFRFSDRAYVQGLLFLLLHTYASHYTYSHTPVGDWATVVFGLSRNHFDRVVHFAFGFLLFVPLREMTFRREPRRALRSELLLTVGAASLLGIGYELLEWGSAVFVGEVATQDFLGAQGDPWDTQADLACNLAGGLVAVGLELALARPHARDHGTAQWHGA